MVALPGIEVRGCWGCVVGYVPVEHVGADHVAGDVVLEFFDLFSNVAQKGIAGPATDHHDEKHRTSTKEHHHCRIRADGVCASLFGGDVENTLSNCQDGVPQRVLDLSGGDVLDAVVMPDGRDRGVVVGFWVGLDPANDGGSCPDWAQCDIA
jgi:hypothetical protein